MNKDIDISNVVLKTERLILRPFKETDIDDFYEYAKVEGVGENAGWVHHQSIEESKQILDMFLKTNKTFAISLNDKVIGSIGIENYTEDVYPELESYKGRELGFVLSKDYWHQGIMSEACTKVIDYLFNDVDLDFIVCDYFVGNERSKGLQDKLGFKFVKTITRKTHWGEYKVTATNILTKKMYIKR